MLHSIIAMPRKRAECSSVDEESFLDKNFQIITFHSGFMFFHAWKFFTENFKMKKRVFGSRLGFRILPKHKINRIFPFKNNGVLYEKKSIEYEDHYR